MVVVVVVMIVEEREREREGENGRMEEWENGRMAAGVGWGGVVCGGLWWCVMGCCVVCV